MTERANERRCVPLSRAWTTPDDIAAKVRRRWDDGSLLRAYGEGGPFEPICLPLSGPRATQIGDDLGAARQWVAGLDSGRRGDARYALEWSSIGGRRIGRNQVPARAVVSSFEQAWALLGVAGDVRRFEEVLNLVEPHFPIRCWVIAKPHEALKLRAEMTRLIAAYLTITLPVATWMLLGFIRHIPRELEEAALIEGATRLQAFVRVIVPLARPGIAATAVWIVVVTWQEFIFALAFTSTKDMRTVSIGMNDFIGQYGIRYGEMMASAIVISIPIMVVFFFLQRQFVAGLTAGATKG